MSDASGIRLDAYVAAVRRRLPWIVALTLLGGITGIALAARYPLEYTARATVAVNQLAGAPPSATPSGPAVLAVFNNQSLITQLVAELGLDRPPRNLSPEAFVKDHLTVEELVPGSLLQIRVRFEDPELAVKVCNRLTALAIELNSHLNAERALAGQEFLKNQVERSRADLADVEQRMLEFKERSQVDLRREEVNALLDARRELVAIDARLAAEKGRLAAASAELAQRSRSLGPLRRGPNRLPTIPPPRTSSYEPRPDEAGAAPNARQPDRPVALGADITRPDPPPETFLADRENSTVDPVYEILDYEVASARVRVAEMESRRRELAGALGMTNGPSKRFAQLYQLESEQSRLQAEYDLASKAYQDAVARLKQASGGQSSTADAFKVVDPALTAPRSARPSYKIAAGLGAALGLGVGLFLAFLADAFREPFRTVA